MGIGLIVVSAFVFYRIAVIEQLSPWQWAGASVLVSLGSGLIGGLFTMAFGQIVLFGVLWWYNVRRKAARGGVGSPARRGPAGRGGAAAAR
jgi:hypothetical protein